MMGILTSQNHVSVNEEARYLPPWLGTRDWILVPSTCLKSLYECYYLHVGLFSGQRPNTEQNASRLSCLLIIIRFQGLSKDNTSLTDILGTWCNQDESCQLQPGMEHQAQIESERELPVLEKMESDGNNVWPVRQCDIRNAALGKYTEYCLSYFC